MNPDRTNTERDALLRRWLTGDVTRKEERRLEEMAQSDPFLADAMDGYDALPGGEHLGSVTRLKGQLRKRAGGQKRSTTFYLLRVAAVGAVLLAGWIVIQQMSGNEAMKDAAVAHHEISSETTAEPAPVEPPKRTLEFAESDMAPEEKMPTDDRADFSEKTKADGNFDPVAGLEKKEGAKKQTAENKRFSDERTAILEEAKILTESGGKEKERTEDLANTSEYTQTEAEPKPAPAPAKDAAEAPAIYPSDLGFADEDIPPYEEQPRVGNSAPMVHKIMGKVTNDFGDPLTGASVVVEESQTGTVTDSDGHFAIETEAVQPNIRISYLGYEEQRLAVQNDDFLNVKLSENEQILSEVTVGRKKSKAQEMDSLSRPKGGFAKLEKYIRKNLRHPAGYEKTSGEVCLRFRINDDGSLTGFEVVRSLGEAFDQEAERLLREGPKWIIGREATATYVIRF